MSIAEPVLLIIYRLPSSLPAAISKFESPTRSPMLGGTFILLLALNGNPDLIVPDALIAVI